MKSSITIFAIIIASSFIRAQNYTVSTPIEVSSGMGYYHPQIEVTGDNQPAILWSDQNSKNIYLAKYNGNTAFLPPTKLNPGTMKVQTFNWSGADLSIDGSNVHVVFKQDGYETGGIYTVKSTNHGASFGDTVRVDKPSFGYGQYPDIAVYKDTVFVTYMNHDHTNMIPQYVVSRSIDGGQTFSDPVIAGELLKGEACDCCQPELVVNKDYLILFFRNNDNNIRDIKGVVSYDRGLTFTDSLEVDKHQWLINQCPSTGADSRFLGNDTIINVYKSSVSNKNKVFLNAYDVKNNTSISTTLISSETDNNPNYPQLAIDGNTIGAVWEGFGNSTDIYFNFSVNGLKDFNPANIYQLTNASGPQSKPDIAYKNGVFHIVYSDYLTGNNYIQVSNLVGLNELSPIQSVSIHPNPLNVSSEKLNFGEQIESLNIYNTAGLLIQSYSGTYKDIKLSNLTAGTYILKFKVHGQLVTQLLQVNP